MRRIVFSLLCLVGAAEVFVGVFWGRLMIYAQEAPFILAMGYSSFSPEQTRAFDHYIRIFKGQRSVVAWFGIATIILAVLLARSPRKSVTPVIRPPDAQ